MVQDFFDNKICIEITKACFDRLSELKDAIDDLKWNSGDSIDSNTTKRITGDYGTIYLNTTGQSIWFRREPGDIPAVTLDEFLYKSAVEINGDEIIDILEV